MNPIDNEPFYEHDGMRNLDQKTNILEEYRFFQIQHEVKQITRRTKSSTLKIVDAGAGWGQISIALAKKGHKVVSLDLSESRLGKFKQEADSLGIVQIKTSLEKIPIKDSSCDLVICSEVLEHLPDPLTILKEFSRITRPQGFLITSVPYAEILTKFICPHCLKSFVPHGHLHSFDIPSFQRLFRETPYSNRKNLVIGKRLASAFLRRNLISFPVAKFIDKIYPVEINRGWLLSIWQKGEPA